MYQLAVLIKTTVGDVLSNNLIAHNLTHGNRQGLIIRFGINQRANMLTGVLLQVCVVCINLAGTAGTENHQAVLRLRLLNQCIGTGVHNTLRRGAIDEVVVLFGFVCHRNSNICCVLLQCRHPCDAGSAKTKELFYPVTTQKSRTGCTWHG